MWKNSKFYIGFSMLIQSFTFLIAFFFVFAKKKNLANTILALAGLQGAIGLFLIYKNEYDERAAMDALYDYSDDFDDEEEAVKPHSEPLTDVPVDSTATESDFR